ncbi:lipase member K-like [Thrips palmi]|uniref:Lipase member K-like n=1 Tax=Thrips palmi TaxID=161013 RepID=A0A6P9A684_THRPL|nr:lipase member K-like [Thrips palmi]
MATVKTWAMIPLALLLVVWTLPTAVSQSQAGPFDPLIEGLVGPVAEGAAGLLPIPFALIAKVSPYTSTLNPLLQSALLQNNFTQFSSDIVTNLSALFGVLAEAKLPVPPFLRPNIEAEKMGFVGEAYNVTTADGYILGVFRIRSGQCSSYRAVVVIPPGLLSNAATFIYVKENSLAYRLARRCFDVWLFTFRGYLFGRGHTHLRDTSSEFWDFYPYHWGAFDLPAQLEFVSNKTGSTRMRLMGVDQTATALLFMNHVHGQRYQRLLASCYIYAPFGYLGRLRSPLFTAMALGRDFLTAAGAVALHNELAFMNPVVHPVIYNLCGRISPITCDYLLQLLAGKTDQLDSAVFPYAFANLIDSISIRAMTYYLQQVGKIKYMAFFDYGFIENMKRYNRSTPENVNLEATTVPCSFYALGQATDSVQEDNLDTWHALAKSAQSTFEVLAKYNGIGPFVPVDTESIYGPAIRQLETDLTRLP